jgi:hypothetical protein
MWKNIVEPGRTHRVQYGAYDLRAGKLRLQTRSEYLILVAFPRQQWLRERAPTLLYARITCVVTHCTHRIELRDRACQTSRRPAVSGTRQYRLH